MVGDTETEDRTSRRDLYAVFEIDLAPESDCPLSGFGRDIESVRRQVVSDECHTDATVRVDDCGCAPERECTEVRHVTSSVEESCACTVFGEFDCVPELVDFADGAIVVETYLPDRERLAGLVSALREITDALQLRQLKRVDTGTAERSRDTVTLDLLEVTEKQREVVTKAVTEGYYSSPQEVSLGDLAADLDVSKSTLSQHLNAVESKLATEAFANVTTYD